MKVLMADDHVLLRDAFSLFVKQSVPDAIILQARDMHDVFEVMDSEEDVDIVLLDMIMPGMDGLKGLERFLARYPETPVALLSGMAKKDQVEQALKMGASGFLPKTLSGKGILFGIRKILDGERYVAFDHNTGNIMPSCYDGSVPEGGLRDAAQAGFEGENKGGGLTPRERDVLSWLLRGASNREIADALGLQVVTVKLHMRGICRKLDVENRTQAALKAQKMNLDGGGGSALSPTSDDLEK